MSPTPERGEDPRPPGARERTRVHLEGVPETLLWTLYHRAVEARRPDAVIDDPLAVTLVDEIDYPFEARFGGGPGDQAQWQGLRAATFDGEVRRFLAARPGGTVVALGEGLETQFWRVDDGHVNWLSVDLPETMAVQERLLPDAPRRRAVACSALDERWMDEVDPSRGVLVTAQGVLMYLPADPVRALIATIARRFPGGALVFDGPPRWLAARSHVGNVAHEAVRFQTPPWTWWLDRPERRRIAAMPNVDRLRALRPPPGRGWFWGMLNPHLSTAPGIRELNFAILVAHFGTG